MKTFHPRSRLLSWACLLALSPFSLHAAASIIGGIEAKAGELPWQVFLNGAGCGGTLLSESWVLTAKHCVGGGSQIKVRAGSVNINEGVVRDVKNTVSHMTEDLALLRVEPPFVLGPDIRPAHYATRADSLAGLTHVGVMGRVSGWGDTTNAQNAMKLPDFLRVVDLPIVSLEQANAKEGCVGCPPQDVKPTELPAAYKEGGKSGCYGDSGGPFVVPDGMGGWLLAGVVSWGGGSMGCAAVGSSSVFARVSSNADWIQKTTGIPGGIHPVAVHRLAPVHPRVSAAVEGGWLYLDLRESKFLEITAHALDGKAYPLSRGVLAVGRHGMRMDNLPNGVYALKAGASYPGWAQRIVLTH